MATFEQRGQIVGTQYNADNITVYGQATPRPEANAAQEMVEPPPVDVVLITPLEEERNAVLAKLDGHRRLPPTADDIQSLLCGRATRDVPRRRNRDLPGG